MARTQSYPRGSCTWLMAGVLAIAACVQMMGQTTKPTAKCKPKDAACIAKDGADAPTAGPTPAAHQFPFPEGDSKGSTGTSRTALPDMPTSGVPDPPAASEQPMHLPPGSSSSGSGDDAGGGSNAAGSSSSQSASDDDDVAPTAAPGDAPVKASALKDLGSRADTSAARIKLEQTRVADDVKVGTYYLKEGNTQGAYLRFKDAAGRAPDEPEARFGLAEAASRLNKRDEAVLNYRQYLQLDGGGDHDKAARKALGKLGASAQ